MEELAASDAIRLFVERARTLVPSLALTAENAATVAAICRRLDGIPLAIELAAARVLVLSVDQIAARLGDRFRLLTGGSRTAPPRHQTLRATIDWSYDLLTEAERVLLRRLAVFAGGFTVEAAESVASCQLPVASSAEERRSGGAEEQERDAVPGTQSSVLSPQSSSLATGDWRLATEDVLDGLARLVDKSLVQVDEGVGGEKRYRLLEMIRQYGWERLQEAGEEAATRDRHRDWCLLLAERADPAVRGPDQLAWLARLEAEHDNLRAALAWCLEGAPPVGLCLAGSLWQFWRVRSHHSEGRRWLSATLSRAPDATPARATALLGAGVLATDQDEFATAQALFEEALPLSRALGDACLIAATLHCIGYLLLTVGDHRPDGDHRPAGSVLEEGLALSRSAGDQRGVGAATLLLGRLARVEGDHARAHLLLEEGLARARAVGDRWLIADACHELGRLARMQGDDARAQVLLAEGLALAQEMESPELIARLGVDMGRTAYGLGDSARAAALYEASLTAAREAEDKCPLARTLTHLAQIAARQGDTARALAVLRESLTLWRTMKPRVGAHVCLEVLAAVAMRQRQPERAARLLGAAAALRAGWLGLVPPAEQADYDRLLATVRAALGVSTFSAAWAAGRALAWEEAIALALSAAVDPAPPGPPVPPPPADGPLAALTLRELEVLRLIAQGATDAAIAAQLSISRKTVGFHVAGILSKMGCANRTAAAVIAARQGLA